MICVWLVFIVRFLYYLCGMKLKRFFRLIMCCMLLSCATMSCVNQNYIMYEDDEWSGGDMDSDRSLMNGELEMDDWDR